MRGQFTVGDVRYEEILSSEVEATRLALTKEAVIFAVKELDLERPIEICWLRMIVPGTGRHVLGFIQPSAPIPSALRRIYLVNQPVAPYIALHELRHLWQRQRMAKGDQEIAGWSGDQLEADAYAYQPAAFARLFGRTRGFAMVERMRAEAKAEGF